MKLKSSKITSLDCDNFIFHFIKAIKPVIVSMQRKLVIASKHLYSIYVMWLYTFKGLFIANVTVLKWIFDTQNHKALKTKSQFSHSPRLHDQLRIKTSNVFFYIFLPVSFSIFNSLAICNYLNHVLNRLLKKNDRITFGVAPSTPDWSHWPVSFFFINQLKLKNSSVLLVICTSNILLLNSCIRRNTQYLKHLF